MSLSSLYRVSRRGVATAPYNPYLKQFANTKEAAPSGELSRFLQANFFRRNAVFVTFVLVGAAVSTGAYDAFWEGVWKANNKGKLFVDVIKRYPNLPPNTEPEAAAEEEAAEE